MRQTERLKKLAEATLEELGIEGSVIEIYLISDGLMKEINYCHQNRRKTTDILSFPAADGPYPETKDRPLGEIYLAPRFIKKNKKSIEELLIHGILHLVGYNHKKEIEWRKMEAKELALKQKLLK